MALLVVSFQICCRGKMGRPRLCPRDNEESARNLYSDQDSWRNLEDSVALRSFFGEQVITLLLYQRSKQASSPLWSARKIGRPKALFRNCRWQQSFAWRFLGTPTRKPPRKRKSADQYKKKKKHTNKHTHKKHPTKNQTKK